jgi:hypothetical protein
MNEHLRPLTLAEILDRTAQLYRSRFLVFLGISTIPSGIVFVFAVGIFAFIAWMGSNSRHGASVGDVFVWAFLVLVAILVVPASLGASALGEAAMSEASARMFLGEPITIRTTYKNTWRRVFRFTGLYVLQGLVIVAAPAIAFFTGIVVMIAAKVSGYAANDNSPLFGGLAFLLFLVLGAFAVWMLLRFCLAFPACVVEQTTAWSALKRSAQLGQGTLGRIFVLYILGAFLNWMLTWVIMLIVVIAVALIPALQGQKHAQAVGMILMFSIYGAYFAMKALIKPVYGIALTLFYFDQRIRKEGFDIEWLMQQAGMVTPPAIATAREPQIESPLPVEPATEPVVTVPVELTAALPAPEQALTSVPGEIKA